MKKVLLLCLFAMAALQSYAITSSSLVTDNAEIAISPEFEGLTVDQFLSLTPKKYKEMTGEKLGFKKTIQLKAAQKTIKTQMSPGEDLEKGLYIVLVIVGLGFIAMGLMDDWKGKNWWMNLILTALCWLPGLIHGLVKMKEYYK